MPFAPINGIELYYDVHGAGHPLVLLHGVGSNHLHWWQQVPELAKSYRVITFDHRGFGLSKDTNGLGPKAFVDDLEALLAELRIERAVLCGQSMGGITVGGYASRHPERVSALVLSCSGGGFFPVPHSDAFVQAVRGAKSYAQFSRISLEQDAFPQRHPVLCFLFESMARLNDHFNLARLLDLRTLKFDVSPLAKARTPLLLLGAQDDHHSSIALEQIRAAVPGARLQTVPGAGHLAFFEAARVYNRLILDFLSTLELRP